MITFEDYKRISLCRNEEDLRSEKPLLDTWGISHIHHPFLMTNGPEIKKVCKFVSNYGSDVDVVRVYRSSLGEVFCMIFNLENDDLTKDLYEDFASSFSARKKLISFFCFDEFFEK
jgi:hypothetical protein